MNWEDIFLKMVPSLVAVGTAIWGISERLLLEKIKKNHQKEIQKHKVSTEMEFIILSDLWRFLDKLRKDTYQIRPEIDVWSDIEGKSDDEVRKTRLDNLSQSYSEVAAVIDLNKPFFPKSVYYKCKEVLKIVIDENHAYQKYKRGYYDKKTSLDYYDEGKINIEKLQGLINEIEVILRKRYRLES